MYKLQIVIVFSIVLLFSSSIILSTPLADAKKSSGTSNTEVSSDKVCGDRLCSEIRFLSRGPSDQQSKFSVGGVIQQSMSGQIMSTSGIVPDWIKNNAGWWSNSAINDDSFIQGIQFLIKEKILNVSSTVIESEGDAKIPQWVKNNAAWWSEGVTSEEDFLNGIEYLIENGIISLE